MKRSFIGLIAVIVLAVGSPLARAASTITVAPASLSLKGPAGKMYTQNFKVSNFTNTFYSFKVDVADVLIEDGKRKFIPAGQTTRSLAASVTPSRTEVRLAPGEEATVPVTFLMPAESPIRAVAVFFHGVPEGLAPNQQKIFMNIGAVVDFSLTGEVVLDSLALDIAPQTATTNTTIRQQLANVGPEPTIVRGVAAFLDQTGKLIGKTAFQQRRFLPGERNAVIAEFPGTLAKGKYRVVSSLEYSGETLTKTTELVIP